MQTLTKADLSKVIVRPITQEEESRWNGLMHRYHYLGFQRMVGNTLKYVAILSDPSPPTWVALVGWGASAFKNSPRDRWIGWTQDQHYKRLQYIANNSRYLIFPWVQIPNLASKVLGLTLRRLSSDWLSRYGHPIVLAETFIDLDRFAGTCYKAAGWLHLGETSGYGRTGGQYFFHGKKKSIWVYPVHQDARQLLSAAFVSPALTPEKEPIMDVNTLTKADIDDLRARLSCLHDYRKKRGIRHDLVSVLTLAICAMISGCRTYAAMGQWAANLTQDLLQRFGCRYHLDRRCYIAPSEPTIRRTLQNIDAEEFDTLIGQWVARHSPGHAIAVDGKCLRGTSHHTENTVYLLSALVHHPGAVIAQQQVHGKSNEIPAFRPLLDTGELQGKVVTADALHTQVEHALYITRRDGEYLFEVKENQRKLFQQVEARFQQNGFVPQDKAETLDKGHGRVEIRRIQTADAHGIAFPFCRQVFRIDRKTISLKTGEERCETSYGITSCASEASRLLSYVRGHWYIENKSHWVRDVTFEEDRSQIRTGAGPQVMALLRNFVIGLFRLLNVENIAEKLRYFSWDPSRAVSLLCL